MLSRHPTPLELPPATVLLVQGCPPSCPAPLTPEPFQLGGGCLAPSEPSCGSSPATPTSDMDFCLNADFQALNRTSQRLRQSGYYYEGLSWQKAADLLRHTAPGTFLVRDSADPRFLFSLSVQTDRGPTSVRLHYVQGHFRLDAEEPMVSSMPLFDCVLRLVDHYVDLSQSAKGSSCVWLDGSGRRDLRVRLYQPLYRKPPSLQHVARLAINRLSPNAWTQLPPKLRNYLAEYPHRH